MKSLTVENRTSEVRENLSDWILLLGYQFVPSRSLASVGDFAARQALANIRQTPFFRELARSITRLPDKQLSLLPRSVPNPPFYLFFVGRASTFTGLAVGRDVLDKLAILIELSPVLLDGCTGDTS